MVIGFIAAGAWISLMFIAVALCRVAGRADDVMASRFPDRREAVRTEARRRVSTPAASRESRARMALFPH